MDHLAGSLGLTPAVVEERLRLMALGPADRDLLRSVAPVIEANAPRFIEELYDHFEASPITARWFTRPETRQRLRAQQHRYLLELFSAPLDWAYVLRRLQIGVVHHRVRLSPRWYVATCAHFVGWHVPLLLDSGPDLATGTRRVVALFRTILFDAALVLDAYGMSLEQSLRAGFILGNPDAAAPAGAPESPDGSAESPAGGAPTFSSLRLDDDDSGERLRFIGIDDRTVSTLRELAPRFREALPHMMEDFYRIFQEWPATRDLLPPATIQRLMRQVSAHWLELAAAVFDRTHAASRTRIGIVHERIGVAAPVYLIGLARQSTHLLGVVLSRATDPVLAATSILRAVFYDTSLVLDAYIDARANSVLRDEGYASQLLASLTVGVAVLDGEMRVRSANPALLHYLGVEAGVVRHMHARDLVPDPRMDSILDDVRRDRSLRKSILTEFAGRHLRATALQLAISSDENSAAPLAILLEDVTDLVAVAPGVHQVKRTLEDLVTVVDAVLWEAEPRDWIFSLVSAPVLALTGFRDVQLLGRARAWLDRIPSPDRERFVDQCNRLRPDERCCIVHRLTHADGGTRWVRSHVVRSDASPDQSRFRGVSLDVTASFLEEQRRLEAVGRLAGSVAHEINGVLTVISGSLGLLADDAQAPNGSPPAEIHAAQEAVGRGAALTRRLQVFAQGAPLRPRPAVLNDLVAELAPELRLAAGHQVRLEVVPQPELWRCEIDTALFANALLNLVANARDSMPAGGRLSVSTRNVPAADVELAADVASFADHVEVAVTDSGGGMLAEVRTRAVEPGFTTKPDATGLGLSVVHGFVHQSRGHLVIESGANQGTTVRLRFPRHLAPTPPPPVRVDPPAGTRRILVVDDDQALAQVLSRILARRGYSARVAHSPEEALVVVAAEVPDAVICDVIFEGEPRGAELGRRLTREYAGLPVIYMSGYTRNSLHLGPDEAFIPKPFDVAQLDATLARVLSAPRRPGPPD